MAASLASAALILMFMNTLSRLLGFVRETAIASVFGASVYTDAYQVAYTIPYFLQMVLGVALVSAVVPVLVRSLDQGRRREAWLTASIAMNLTFVFMAVLTCLGILGAGFLTGLTAPGFDAAARALAARMTAIMFPSIMFMSVAMLITGILNACRRFAAAAFAPALAGLIIILGVVLFGARHPDALPLASLISFIAMPLVQLPALKAAGFQYSFSFDYKNPLVRGIFSSLGAVFLGTATYQLYLAINRFFASSLPAGSISALNYAGKLMNLPLGIFVAAVSSSIFPLLAAQALEEDKRSLWTSANRGLRQVLMITLPAAAGLMALGQPIVKLLFERAAFTAEATNMTAQALFWFGPGMGAMAATQVLTRAYYALGDTRTPLIFGLSSIAVNIAASILLVAPLRQGGLALANSLASFYYALGMYLVLRRRLPRAGGAGLPAGLAKVLAASAMTTAAALLVWRLLAPLPAFQDGMGLLVAVGAAVGTGMASYLLVILVLRDSEFLFLLTALKSRLRRRAGRPQG